METTTQGEATKLRGVIKKVKRLEGYAWLTDEASGIDYFLHRTALLAPPWNNLEEGDRLEFDGDAKAEKGPRAWNAKVVEAA